MATMETLSERHDRLRQTLQRVGQDHLLNFYDELSESQRERLLDQIEQHDWDDLAELVETHVQQAPRHELPRHLEPAPYYPADPAPETADRYEEARRIGERLIAEGKVAAFTVAGGQGTRLGWDGPKGTFPATPIHRKPLFQVFAEQILATQRKYEVRIGWYIMTSPDNDEQTRRFFAEHEHFGLDPQQIVFFPQNTVPSFSLNGRALLAAPDRLAENPDGHGGSLRALHTSGALDQMIEDGIEQISYFQVDNPLVRCIDPLFIGLHAMDEAQMSSKMVAKADPHEKVGVLCLADRKVRVIEYSDLPSDLAEERDSDGSLRYNAGSIAVHVIRPSFVRQLNEGRFSLPFHRAVKKVAHVDPEMGERVDPPEPNAVKLETFVFDALPLCERSVVLETKREEEFAPIKNAEGSDSAHSSRLLQSDRAARWLQQHGLQVPWNAEGHADVTIELSPLTALEPADLKRATNLPAAIESDDELAL